MYSNLWFTLSLKKSRDLSHIATTVPRFYANDGNIFPPLQVRLSKMFYVLYSRANIQQHSITFNKHSSVRLVEFVTHLNITVKYYVWLICSGDTNAWNLRGIFHLYIFATLLHLQELDTHKTDKRSCYTLRICNDISQRPCSA